jgi:hypothetical protein
MDYSRFERSRGERAHCTHRQVNRKSFFSGRTLEGRGRGGGGGGRGPVVDWSWSWSCSSKRLRYSAFHVSPNYLSYLSIGNRQSVHSFHNRINREEEGALLGCLLLA